MLKIAKSKKHWGSVKTERSKNQSQVFPSHIMDFRNKKSKGEKNFTYVLLFVHLKKVYFPALYIIIKPIRSILEWTAWDKNFLLTLEMFYFFFK